MEDYNGFELKRKKLNGRDVTIVFPKKGTENGRWALKSEYFEAFPDVQIKLLEKGYHLAYIQNKTRFHVPEDTEARAALAEYMHSKYGLSEKCVLIGMSCGGMQGIYFATKYPQYVSCMYLDAPVVNFLSCPAGLGRASGLMWEEFETNIGMTMSELIGYRNHPLDNLPKLVKHKIPVILVSGDSDKTVPYEENGMFLDQIYRENGIAIETIIKKGGDHHPHGLEDNTPIIEFILRYDKY